MIERNVLVHQHSQRVDHRSRTDCPIGVEITGDDRASASEINRRCSLAAWLMNRELRTNRRALTSGSLEIVGKRMRANWNTRQRLSHFCLRGVLNEIHVLSHGR